MERLLRGVAIAPMLLAVAMLTACMPRQPWQSELASVNAAGTDSGNGESFDPVFSPDGTKIAFYSEASDLGPRDTNGQPDVYVRDLLTGRTTLVSVNAAGTDGGNGWSVDPAFAGDGTNVVFRSKASDLGPHDSNDLDDVYARDLVAGTTTLVSVDAAGADGGNGLSTMAVVSRDGTAVAFVSTATDLGPTDANAQPDVYVRDLVAGTTTLASVNAAGTDGGNGGSLYPALSADGTKVAFVSGATDLGPPDTTRPFLSVVLGGDVYVRDLVAGTTALASANATGTNGANADSLSAVLSPDGTKVAFHTKASDLGPHDTGSNDDVYVRDLVVGTTTLVSVNQDGTGGGNGWSAGLLTFSPDGTKVAFYSTAGDLAPVDTPSRKSVFVRDRASGTTSLVSVHPDGTGLDVELTSRFGFSPDGTKIAFSGAAANLDGTSTGHDDVYVRDLVHGTTAVASVDPAGTGPGNDDSSLSELVVLEAARFQDRAVFSPSGARLVFMSRATNLSPIDRDGQSGSGASSESDVYVATLRGADLSVDGQVEADPVEPSSSVTYRFDVANAGPDPAEDVSLAVLLPEGVRFGDLSATLGQCTDPATVSPQLVVCQWGDVPVDATGTVTIRASIDAPAGASLTALGAVSSASTVDPVHNNDVAVLEFVVAGA